MSQSAEQVTMEVTGNLTAQTRADALGSIALLDPEALAEQVWASEGGLCPAE